MINKDDRSYFIHSLGCAKNLVDSNAMAQILENSGYFYEEDPSKAKVVIINTCGFIADAKKESQNLLKEVSAYKKKNQIIIAAGCLTQRYPEILSKELKKIDGFLGTRNWSDILKVIEGIEHSIKKPKIHVSQRNNILLDHDGISITAIQGTSAYLKIADGCRRNCAYCAIPLIKGPLVSRPLEKIINDAIYLQSVGVKEINLIAQDVTDYGYDLQSNNLINLLSNLINSVPQIDWIRLLYTYPGNFSEELIELMALSKKILNYIDMPLQHANPSVLRSMNRPSNIDWFYRTIENIRKKIPNVALRTTFIVGYPTENQKAFDELLQFIKDIKFDHLGAFIYSFEEGTPAEKFGDPISIEEKKERLKILMETQESITLSKNLSFIGSELDILIEGVDKENHISVGRSYRDAPEVDGLCIVNGLSSEGEIIKARIKKAFTHDLYGEMI